jgi:hypothetical protein
VVSKTIDAPYAPGNRGLWRKAKWLNRQEFVVRWSDPEGSRPHLGALLLDYYTDDGKLTYAGRVGTGCPIGPLPICGVGSTRLPVSPVIAECVARRNSSRRSPSRWRALPLAFFGLAPAACGRDGAERWTAPNSIEAQPEPATG